MKSNRPNQIRVRDWFALGQIFTAPFYFDDPHSGDPLAVKYGVNIGVQALAASDVVSQYMLHARPIAKTPSALTAQEILTFLNEVFEKHGLPRIGIFLGPSIWMSSAEMLLDDVLAKRGELLRTLDIEIGPMQNRDKETFVASMTERGLKVEFDEDNLGLI